MKVRRRSVGKNGKCKVCGAILHATRANLEARPKRGQVGQTPHPGADVYSDPFGPAVGWEDPPSSGTPPMIISTGEPGAEAADAPDDVPPDAPADAFDAPFDAGAAVSEAPRPEEADVDDGWLDEPPLGEALSVHDPSDDWDSEGDAIGTSPVLPGVNAQRSLPGEPSANVMDDSPDALDAALADDGWQDSDVFDAPFGETPVDAETAAEAPPEDGWLSAEAPDTDDESWGEDSDAFDEPLAAPPAESLPVTAPEPNMSLPDGTPVDDWLDDVPPGTEAEDWEEGTPSFDPAASGSAPSDSLDSEIVAGTGAEDGGALDTAPPSAPAEAERDWDTGTGVFDVPLEAGDTFPDEPVRAASDESAAAVAPLPEDEPGVSFEAGGEISALEAELGGGAAATDDWAEVDAEESVTEGGVPPDTSGIFDVPLESGPFSLDDDDPTIGVPPGETGAAPDSWREDSGVFDVSLDSGPLTALPSDDAPDDADEGDGDDGDWTAVVPPGHRAAGGARSQAETAPAPRDPLMAPVVSDSDAPRPDRGGPETVWDNVAPPATQNQPPPPRAAAFPDDGDTWDAVAPPAGGAVAPGRDAVPPVPNDGHTQWDSVAPASPDAVTAPHPRAARAPEAPGAPAPSDAVTRPNLASPPAEDSGAGFADTWGDVGESWFDQTDERAQPAVAHGGRKRQRLARKSRGGAKPEPTPGITAAPLGARRIPWLVFPLCVVTGSVFFLVWVYQVFCELRDHLVRTRSTHPGWAVGLLAVPGFNLLWSHYLMYRMAADLNELHHLEGREPAMAAGGIAAMAVSGTTLILMGGGLVLATPQLGAVGLAAGLALWWGCLAALQAALNAHWALHVR